MKYNGLSKGVYKNVLVASAVVLVACSSTPSTDDSKTLLATQELKKQLEQQKTEWEAVKPDIERLLALEEDFKLLIQSLNTSQLSSSPPNLGGEIEATPLVEATPPISPVENILTSHKSNEEEKAVPEYVQAKFNTPSKPLTKKALVSDTRNAIKTQQFAVQVAAYDNEIQLAKGWLRLQGSFPELMSTVNPIKEKIVVKNKSLWALKVGPFKSRSAGNQYCSDLKKRNQDCFIGMYQGEEL
ncbi:SPOR domain-containing protein [Marinomonas sp. 15G1-11]|uniref:SPOR domain-containing protein n=1 Tax=Marinomonas phaeophyticola TaxID=3004091 RepID=A0ABT4JQQ9_9GAMM|nr:SPOR domain-containing protein [Marinomonas sp. 15G1-11]MCZ2720688.1 SPOR domain-containing protein [Marinomonas sp. 15G1-11]